MPHDVPLITTIAAALGLALIMGFVAARLKLPALVGYLIAGIIIGPATPGLSPMSSFRINSPKSALCC